MTPLVAWGIGVICSSALVLATYVCCSWVSAHDFEDEPPQAEDDPPFVEPDSLVPGVPLTPGQEGIRRQLISRNLTATVNGFSEIDEQLDSCLVTIRTLREEVDAGLS